MEKEEAREGKVQEEEAKEAAKEEVSSLSSVSTLELVTDLSFRRRSRRLDLAHLALPTIY